MQQAVSDTERMLVGWSQICFYLGGISERTAYRWWKDKGMPVVNLGNTPVTWPSLIQTWLLEIRKAQGVSENV